MKENNIIESFLDAIDIMIKERFKEISNSNYYIEASIKTVNAGNTVNIDYNGEIYPNVKKREGLSLVVGDIVLVCIVNGNFSNKFVDLKRP